MRYNESMAILENFENAWDVDFQDDIPYEHQNLAVKTFTEICCNGCTCKSESAHKPEYSLDEVC